MTLTKSEREEFVFLAYYEQFARSTATLDPIERCRLATLRAKIADRKGP